MGQRPSRLPIIVVTGASGFIGRNFLKSFNYDFYIYALARRSQKDAGVPFHKNINWIRLDISDESQVERVIDDIADKNGADYFLHLAGYYDFDNVPHEEFKKTNVNGTKYILKNLHKLKIKRFIFSSSLTVSEFIKSGKTLTEDSPADASFPYAVSKKKCEELIHEYSDNIPSTVMRLAAVFSDWCEYGPLYNFLSTWLANSWNSRILAGNGEAAIPYIHVKNLNSFIYSIINNSEYLSNYNVVLASHPGSTSQNALYDIASKYNYGTALKPLYIPKWFAYIGVIMLDILGKMTKNRPFERPWMIKYIDTDMRADPEKTYKLLSWKPIQRYRIERRLLFLIENMKSNPVDWHRLNQEAILKRRIASPNLKIFECMVSLEDELINEIAESIFFPENKNRFTKYKKLNKSELKNRITYVYFMLKTAVRTGDRVHGLSYASNLALARFKEDFEAKDVVEAITFISENVVAVLNQQEDLKDMEQRIYDEIMMTTQLIVDELEDSFDRLMGIE